MSNKYSVIIFSPDKLEKWTEGEDDIEKIYGNDDLLEVVIEFKTFKRFYCGIPYILTIKNEI